MHSWAEKLVSQMIFMLLWYPLSDYYTWHYLYIMKQMCFVLSVQALSVFSVKTLSYGSNKGWCCSGQCRLIWHGWHDVILWLCTAVPATAWLCPPQGSFPSAQAWHGTSLGLQKAALRAQWKCHGKEAGNRVSEEEGVAPHSPPENQSFSYIEIAPLTVEK